MDSESDNAEITIGFDTRNHSQTVQIVFAEVSSRFRVVNED